MLFRENQRGEGRVDFRPDRKRFTAAASYKDPTTLTKSQSATDVSDLAEPVAS